MNCAVCSSRGTENDVEVLKALRRDTISVAESLPRRVRRSPFYFWVKDADGIYLWGSAEMDRFAGGAVAGKTDADFGPPAESPTTLAALRADDRAVLHSDEPLYTHERIEGAGNLSVCKWADELDGRRVTFGVSFLVPGD
jgi:hypothetical protein